MKITEPNTIHERIDIIVRYFCKGNKTAFGRETDILPGVLASITGGRMSKPSFELLQKIVTRYPAVNGDWLLLGREPMLKDDTTGVMHVLTPAIDKHLEQTLRRFDESKAVLMNLADAKNPDAARQVRKRATTEEAIAKQEMLMRLYHVGGQQEVDSGSLLANRLGISEDEAQNLVATHKVRATDFGSKLGFRVSELAVREFLGEE
jgi:hypothetical protein